MKSKTIHIVKDILLRIFVAALIAFLINEIFNINLYLILIIAGILSIPIELYFNTKIKRKDF